MPSETINYARMAFILSGFSALKDPSFLQRTMFPFAFEGKICEGSKRTGALVSCPPWMGLNIKDSRFCCFEGDKIGGTIITSS